MRVTTAFKRLLRLEGVNVTDVTITPVLIVVTVALRRRRLVCPHCPFKTSARYDTRPAPSWWRHLDIGTFRVEVRASLRRLRCPTHGVVTEMVPFARPGANLTRDFDDLLAWLATRMDKSSIARLCRVAWRTVGTACERVVADELDPRRLDGLFRIGVDEISWRKHHSYLTLVVDHDHGVVVWGAQGKDSATLDKFFDELGTERSALIEAVSMDLGPAYLKSVRTEGHAPQAIVCADVFHLVKLVGDALDEVRRELWQTLRRLPDDRWAKDFKGSRWALLKNPEDLTDRQAEQLAKIKRNKGGIWRAYEMKEQFRAIFAGDVTRDEAAVLLDAWCARAQRCRLPSFVKAARTMRERRDLILNAIEHGISNGRVEDSTTSSRG
ncbi:MAG: ISL3 family transposase ISAar34 [Acidimicrobiales bacterium]|nr:MAG: ISL3 family transposase [Actinomycetota bacterium]MBV6508724.1 ISL3 family transposase ISAar34 [Acidimicrobiales bacterium]RIK08156.1 MAG: ISL3 family transposase [Acidobacteriota bacterium]